MSLENKTNQTCRICMCDSNPHMRSIFSFESFSDKSLQIKEVITTCASVQIQMCDGLPEQICCKCLDKLHEAFTFKETCETSDYRLRTHFIKCEVTTEWEEEDTNISNFTSCDEINLKEELDVESPKIESRNKRDADHFKGSDDSTEMDRLFLETSSVNNPELLSLKTEESLTKDINNEDSSAKKQKLTCTICNKHLRYKTDFEIHMRTHTGEKPYQCDICRAGFGTSGNLKVHKKIHEGNKPHKCDVCQKGFTHSNSLRRHILHHTGEKRYKCDICQKTFTQTHNLKMHMLRHKGERAFECDTCKMKFYTNGLLSRHKKTHTGLKPHKCDVCDKSYRMRRSLIKHKAKFHTENCVQST